MRHLHHRLFYHCLHRLADTLKIRSVESLPGNAGDLCMHFLQGFVHIRCLSPDQHDGRPGRIIGVKIKILRQRAVGIQTGIERGGVAEQHPQGKGGHEPPVQPPKDTTSVSSEDGGSLNEEPLNPGRRAVPGSTAYVPAAAGLMIAAEIVKDLISI